MFWCHVFQSSALLLKIFPIWSAMVEDVLAKAAQLCF